MNSGKICISVCARTVGEFLEKIEIADRDADIVEVRFDCLGPEDVFELLARLPQIRATYLFTYRSAEEGGNRELTLSDRLKFWEPAISTSGHDFMIDIEAEEALSVITGSRGVERIISKHSFHSNNFDPEEIWKRISLDPASIGKVAVSVNDAAEAVAVWKLLDRSRQENRRIIPIAMGEAGKWTRILGPVHGAYLTYTAPDGISLTGPGQLTITDAADVYRIKELDQNTEVYGIIAGDTSYSMSPYIHNAAFKASGLNAVFVPLQVRDLDAFVRRMLKARTREVELNLRGLSVTNPHKQQITKHLDDIEESARRIGAVNTIKVVDDRLHGFNTDAEGFIRPLRAMVGDLADVRVAVFGAGGAARACTYALKTEGSKVTVFARDKAKADKFAADMDVTSAKLNDAGRMDKLSGFDIVVNATPLGTRGEDRDETLATAEQLAGVKLVYDLVYNPAETRLLREAKAAGAVTLGGFDMLIAQAERQFEIWTGMDPPVNVMAEAARKRLDES